MAVLLSHFESQPPELLICLVPYLNLEDYMSLCCTSKRLRGFLNDDRICEVIAKQHLRYSLEFELVEEGLVSYSYAVRRAFSRKQALALGKPYSVVTLGYGTSFFYKDGFLCYLAGQRIRFLDVFNDCTREQVIDFTFVANKVESEAANGLELSNLDILDYNKEMLSLGFTYGHRTSVVSLETAEVSNEGQMTMMVVPSGPKTTIVRTDSRYVLAATYTGRVVVPNGHPRHEWQIRWAQRHHRGSRTRSEGRSESPEFSTILQLRNFFGVDIGQTVAFEIFDGYLYAVSNQSTFEVEEVDWTSYYHCWRINLELAIKKSWLHTQYPISHKRVWRRQHREGVINDNWTDLSLHKDEKTGIVTIVEARKEYLGMSSDAVRTFYTQPLLFDDAEDDNVVEVFSSPKLIIVAPKLSYAAMSPYAGSHPVGDVLARTLGKGDLPNYEEPPLRIPSSYHVEPRPPADTQPPLASTYKFRTYVPSSAASLDLIQKPGSNVPSFRISSRYLDSPIDPKTRLLRPRLYDEKYQETVMDSELAYVDRKTVVWPPPDAPPLLKELLNPHSSGRPGPTRAMGDSRCLVYTSGAPHSTLGQAITMINFDRFINFEVSIPSTSSARTQSATFKNAETDIGVEKMREKMAEWRRSVWSETSWTVDGRKWMDWEEGIASWRWYEKSWALRGVGGEYIVQRD